MTCIGDLTTSHGHYSLCLIVSAGSECSLNHCRYIWLATRRDSVKRFQSTLHSTPSISITSSVTWHIAYRYRLSIGSVKDHGVNLLSSVRKLIHNIVLVGVVVIVIDVFHKMCRWKNSDNRSIFGKDVYKNLRIIFCLTLTVLCSAKYTVVSVKRGATASVTVACRDAGLSPSVLWYCWLGLLTCETVSYITYTVLVERR